MHSHHHTHIMPKARPHTQSVILCAAPATMLAAIIMAAVMAVAGCTKAMAARQDYNKIYDMWKRLPCKTLIKKGNIFRNVQLKQDSAMVCYSIIINRYYQGSLSAEDQRHCVVAMNSIGQIYLYEYNDFPQSYKYTKMAEELATEIGFDRVFPYIYINLATLSSYQRAIGGTQDNGDMNKKAIITSLRQKEWYPMKVATINYIANAYFSGKLPTATKEIALVKDSVPDTVAWKRQVLLMASGMQKAHEGKVAQAIDLMKAFKNNVHLIASPQELPSANILANSLLCHLYMTHKMYGEAFNMLEQIMAVAKAKGELMAIMNAYDNMAQYYKETGQKQLYDKYRLMYLEKKDEVINKKKLGTVAEMRFLYEMQKKNDEAMEMARKQESQRVIIYSVSGLSLVILVLLVLLMVKYRQMVRNNKFLYKKALDTMKSDEERSQLIVMHQQQITTMQGDNHTDSECHGQEPSLEPAYPQETTQGDMPAQKYGTSPMNDDDKARLWQMILTVMETQQDILSVDFSLARLTEMVGSKRQYVSQVINEKFEKPFNTLLNEYRIKEACKRMRNRQEYAHYTIEALGESVGFRSRTSFNTAFKQFTGLTPSSFMRMVKEEANQRAEA